MNPDDRNFRTHGDPPFRVVLVHGGPGARGYMLPMAEHLSKHCGVIEAFQTKFRIEELLLELDELIHARIDLPLVLIGHSWGAWLAAIYASKFPRKVGKLILVSSAPFQSPDADRIDDIRRERIGEEDSVRLIRTLSEFESASAGRKSELFAGLASIFRKADAFSLLDQPEPETDISFAQYEAIWKEADDLRSSGKLIDLVSGISCPVLAIHGDHDPHPAAGVEKPMRKIIPGFRFELLEKCGHEPWNERFARDRFFELLLPEI